MKANTMIKASTETLAELVDAILTSYESQPTIRHIDSRKMASRDAVIEIVHLLRELLFPGYFGKQALTPRSLEYHVGRSLNEIKLKLNEQVHNAIQHQASRGGEFSAVGSDVRAEEIVHEVLKSIPRLRAILATDVQAAFEGDPAASDTDEIIFSYPGFLAISIYRIAHEFHVRGVPLIPRIMSEYAHSVTGIDIHAGARIDESFFIDHGTGVVIGETTSIGKRVKIYQGVTLGALSTREGQKLRGIKRHPTLEDNVTVYSGASVLGGQTVVGSGAVINSNVFVTQSVPPNTRVSAKNPELQYKDRTPQEFKQVLPMDWVI